MMEKNYQLVAWTRNVDDMDNARVYMIPSLECEMQAEFISEIALCNQAELKNLGKTTAGMATRTIRAYEQAARFELLTGHVGDCIRYLCFAALRCFPDEVMSMKCRHTDRKSFSGELRHEFTRLCEEAVALARKHGREDILLENKPKHMLDLYLRLV